MRVIHSDDGHAEVIVRVVINTVFVTVRRVFGIVVQLSIECLIKHKLVGRYLFRGVIVREGDEVAAMLGKIVIDDALIPQLVVLIFSQDNIARLVSSLLPGSSVFSIRWSKLHSVNVYFQAMGMSAIVSSPTAST